ncbi:MAG: hypothetical protein NZ878_06555 [SAR324 cluster bacterium]|nr:hypothetical protein [SAR324 cluster bacterium]
MKIELFRQLKSHLLPDYFYFVEIAEMHLGRYSKLTDEALKICHPSWLKDTFVLNKILFHVALLSFNLNTKRFPDESMYAASIFLLNLYTFFTSNPSIFGKFAKYSLSAAHDAIKITKNNWEIKTEKIFILSAFK